MVCVDGGHLLPCAALAWGKPAQWAYRRSALARFALRRWRATPRSAAEWDALYTADGPYEDAWRSVESEMARIREATTRHGATFVVVAIPQRPPWNEKHAYVEKRLQRWSAAHDAVFVPLLDTMRAAESSGPLYWERDGHCTPSGYTVVAEAVTATLIARGLVP
jgi:hypothetical protein